MADDSKTWSDELVTITTNVRSNNNRCLVMLIEDHMKQRARKGFFNYSCSLNELSLLGYEENSYDLNIVVEKLRDQGLKVFADSWRISISWNPNLSP